MTTKSQMLMVRLTPELKAALKMAAVKERRSVNNLVELLISKHCESEGILPETHMSVEHPPLSKK